MSPARSGWPMGGNWESLNRAEDRMGGETSQLAPARYRCAEYRAESTKREEPLKNGGSKQNMEAHTEFTVMDER